MAVNNSDILAKAKSYIGQYRDGPDVPRLMQDIARVFPDLASYCSQAEDSTPWCGIFVAKVLSDFGIKPPGPDGRGIGFMYVNRWLDFGQRVPVSQRQPGDIAIFLGSPSPHHVTFCAGGNSCVGGNQGDTVSESRYRTPDAVRRISQAVAQPIPAPTTMARYTNIIATEFGGSSDPNTSAYDGHFISDSEYGVAFPYHFKGPRPKVRVFKGSRYVDCAIVDVGPWNINDPYWLYGARPQAESGTDMSGRRTNKAGIDLTPAAARALGIDGKGAVDWQFLSATSETGKVMSDQQDTNQQQSQLPIPLTNLTQNPIAMIAAWLLSNPQALQALQGMLGAVLQQQKPPLPPPPPPPQQSTFGVGTGILGTILSLLGMQQGAIAVPFTPGSSIWSLLSVVLPIALSLFGTTGGPMSILKAVLGKFVQQQKVS